ncbi:MAG TPA: AI-2E family transporter YdiK [Accumulibacter sp.]|nr:AI-2E family transporter YdiK [Accumulibacter sp.]
MLTQASPTRQLARTTFSVLLICSLLIGSVWILSPFLPALLWAMMIAVATWPLLLRLQRSFRHRRAPAVTIMTTLVLLLLIVPLSLATSTLVQHADQIIDWGKSLAQLSLPSLPSWIAELPVLGELAADYWARIASSGAAELATQATPYAGRFTRWLVTELGNVGGLLLQFLLTVALTAVFYSSGERYALSLRRFGRRLGGEQGDQTVVLAGKAIRAVALGVGITALVQAVLGGIGLFIAGVPLAALLSVLMFLLCIAQIGPILVLLPAIIWLYAHDSGGWATFLLVWSLVVVSIDNFLRPMLIKQGADLPMLLILAGVIGGMLAFGLVGIFIGPVVLAVAFTLLQAWVDEETPSHTVQQENGAAKGPPPLDGAGHGFSDSRIS